MKLKIIARLNKKDKINASTIKQILTSHRYLYESFYQADCHTKQPQQITTCNTLAQQHCLDNQDFNFRYYFQRLYTVYKVKDYSAAGKMEKLNRKLYPFIQLVKSPKTHKASKCQERKYQTKKIEDLCELDKEKIRKVNSSASIRISQQKKRSVINKKLSHQNKSCRQKELKQTFESSNRYPNKKIIEINPTTIYLNKISKAKGSNQKIRESISTIKHQFKHLKKNTKLKRR